MPTRRFALGLLAALGLSAMPGLAAADKPKVVTTFTVIADMARNVAGDAADVVSVTKPGAEIHNYQPTPRDLLRAQDADLILWNGLNWNAGSNSSCPIWGISPRRWCPMVLCRCRFRAATTTASPTRMAGWRWIRR